MSKTQLLANTSWDFPLSGEGCDGARGQLGFGGLAKGSQSPPYFPTYFGAPELDYIDWMNSAGGISPCRIGVSGADEGIAGWDAAAKQYVLIYSNGYGIYVVSLFDRADLPTIPICTVTVTTNFDSRYSTPYNVHPFQPALWSPCKSATATRIHP
jgi:hypothetical protein